MAITVKIDFDNIYELSDVREDLRVAKFETTLQDGASIPLVIAIDPEQHEKLPNVYNLAFGPLNRKGQIDDKAELPHEDYSRVFSTILLSALQYLEAHPDHYIGIDGSDNLRAYLYWRQLQRNFTYLDEHFDMYGIKYYVRITRYGKTQYDDPFDFDDILPTPELITKMNHTPKHMYNYFIFKLRTQTEEKA